MVEYDHNSEEGIPFTVNEPPAFYNAEKDFTTLEAWKKAREVKLFFYHKILPRLPKDEKFNLDIQIRKASISSTANIAEGYGRFHYQEGIQFYRIARGSLYELKDHLISCYDLKYISQDLLSEGSDLIEHAKITLNGYINFVKRQKKG
ncbi:MAG: four helix bundle protein [candidate division KSB1 bacterium]|nr:four helix bundle protein [candidate division KSB1 bacterium]